jgi:endonuclease/exonuclease/phosphatase (EEP) superfamily protein YafD
VALESRPAAARRRITLTAQTAGVVLYNLHIESGGYIPLRRSQLAEVLEDASHESRRPVVIGGDFNNAAGAAGAPGDLCQRRFRRRTDQRHWTVAPQSTWRIRSTGFCAGRQPA